MLLLLLFFLYFFFFKITIIQNRLIYLFNILSISSLTTPKEPASKSLIKHKTASNTFRDEEEEEREEEGKEEEEEG